ncbi:MAG: hypothetical protein CMH55_11150 [Myxococcales bacterium]|nr:hypothetical protein [Myxococcales bacterium]
MRLTFALTFALSACGPSLSGEFTSSDGKRQAFDVSGTVVAWVDQVDANLVSRETPALKLFLSGLQFSAEDDFLAHTGSELADLQLRFATSDAVGFTLIDANRRGKGETVELATAPNAATCPQVNGPVIEDLGCLRVAPPPLEAATNFDAIRPLGRGAQLKLELDAGARQTGQAISGRITLTIEAVEGDNAAEVLVGTAEGGFSGTLVGERLAERNMALLMGSGP